MLLSGDSDGQIYIWYQKTFELFQILNGHSKDISSIVALKKENIVSGSLDKTIVIWQKLIINETSYMLKATLFGHTDFINFIVALPNDLIASSSHDTSIRIWNLTTFECVGFLNDHTTIVWELAVLDNGNMISVSEDKSFIEWNIHSMNKIINFNTTSALTSVAVYLNDSFITADLDYNIKIWSSSFLENTSTLRGYDDPVHAIAVLNDGYLVSSSSDKSVRIWDNFFESTVINLKSDVTLAMKVMKNGTLIKASENKTITFWDTNQFILNDTIF